MRITQNPIKNIKNLGFTLIELVVTLAALTILITGTFVGFNKYNQIQKLNSAYDNLKTDLNEAKSSALSQTIVTSGAGSCGVTGMTMTLVGDQIYFPDQYSYRLKEVCKDSSGVMSYPPIRTVNLPSGITHNQSGVTVQFNILNAGAANLVGDLSIVLSLGGSTRTITVTPGGLIK